MSDSLLTTGQVVQLSGAIQMIHAALEIWEEAIKMHIPDEEIMATLQQCRARLFARMVEFRDEYGEEDEYVN